MANLANGYLFIHLHLQVILTPFKMATGCILNIYQSVCVHYPSATPYGVAQ